jgi:RNA polymerase sigma-70 factor, ECF subfamily
MKLAPLSEAEIQDLVRRAQDGEDEAFARLYDHFFDGIYRYSAFRLPVELAEDVTADVFVKAWEKLHTYRLHRSVPFGAWLFRIARHKVIDVYRTRHQSDELTDMHEDPDQMNRAEARTQRNDRIRIVRAAMDKLPTRYREILVLLYVSDLPVSEIARTLRMTEGGVRILKLRALRKLEGLLPPESDIAA